MTRAIIRVEGLSKSYRLLQQDRERYIALRDVISDLMRRPFRPARDRVDKESRAFWALNDVSFDLNEGEILGVIGRNGAGKSTLLKLLSRITEPTRGRIEMRGRVASLLEVGTGFHPELTGRENIYLNGAILGMSRSEIKRHFDQIVAFAEVEKFLDTPVKRYSSGMYVRLAFAVAAHLETEILIVDEVLAVGDAKFQRKCLGRMNEVRQSGRTVILVTHNLGTILNTATTGLVLSAGEVRFVGDVRQACRIYQAGDLTTNVDVASLAFSGPLRALTFTEVLINGIALGAQHSVTPGEAVTLVLRGTSTEMLRDFRFSAALFSEGRRVLTMHDGPGDLDRGEFEVTFRVPPNCLRPGDFSLAFGGRRISGDDWTFVTDVAAIEITEEWSQGYDRDDIGIVNIPYEAVRTSKSRGRSLAAVGV